MTLTTACHDNPAGRSERPVCRKGPTMPARPGAHAQPRSHAGFTLIQLLVALGILATLAGLLLAAMSVARRSAVRGADTQIMGGISTGMSAFTTTFDIAPPLVRDVRDDKTIETVTIGPATVSVIAVYTPAADAAFLRGDALNIDGKLANPLAVKDQRYSIDSLGFYLVGVLQAPYRADSADVPIDLVAGPGTGKPNLSGGFEKGKFGPFVEAGGKTLQIVRDDDKTKPTAELRDRNGIAIRYYHWLKDKTVTTWDNLNLPPMIVGPDYAKFHSSTPPDQRQQADARVTAANWGIVMAGPNRVFGDEPIAEIVQALQSYEGASVDASMSEAALRARAWADNLVEVGSAKN